MCWAARIMSFSVEMEPAVHPQSISASGETVSVDAVTIIPQNKLSEAGAALAVLGYSQSEISVALRGVDVETLSLEQIIRAALKNMMKN